MSQPVDPGIFDPKYAMVMSFRQLIKDIDRSLSDISGVPIKSDASGQAITNMKESYKALEVKVNKQIEGWSKTDITLLSSTLQEYKSEKEKLDEKRKPLLPEGSLDLSFSGLAHNIAQKTLQNFATISVISAFIFGGVVMSNVYVNEPLLLRLFYFVYGAALFPFSLLYGIINTPTWHAAVFPLVERTKSALPLFSYSKPSAYSATGGNKIPLLLCCVVNLLMVFVSLSLLSS